MFFVCLWSLTSKAGFKMCLDWLSTNACDSKVMLLLEILYGISIYKHEFITKLILLVFIFISILFNVYP